jgi:anti-sigma factor RsiW
MMNDCQNVEVREALPDLVHGTLSSDERARVQEHLDQCVDCAAELAIIHAVHAGIVTPSVNVAGIVAAIPPYRRQRSGTLSSGIRPLGMRRVYLELAAACLIGVIGISTFTVRNSGSIRGRTQPASISATTAGSGLALVNTAELTDDGLAQLTRDLDNLQALPTIDPESVTPVALEGDVEPGTVGDSA